MVAAHVFNPSTQEVEAGRSLNLKSAWSTQQVPGQLGLHRETVLQNKKQQLKKIQSIHFEYSLLYANYTIVGNRFFISLVGP